MKQSKILIVEDNPETRRFLESMLSQHFEVITAENGVIAVDYARNKQPDLILMDALIPVLSGYDACSLLKKDEKTKRIPIFFLSAKNTTADVNYGLSFGADDYITKPFDFKELLTRIQSRLNRAPDVSLQPLQMGDLRIDPGTRDIWYGGKAIILTLTEFDILRFLATKNGQVVSREDILKEVWKDDSSQTSDRTIDVHIRAIRKKIPAMSKHILSIYGVGYKYMA